MTDAASTEPTRAQKARSPLYPRLLRLRHISPNAWQRALLGEGALALAALLVLADLATAWTLLVLPLAVAVVVKAHDVLAGRLSAADLRPVAEPHAEDEALQRSVVSDPAAEISPAREAPAGRGAVHDRGAAG